MPKLDNGSFGTKFGYQIDKQNDTVGFEDSTHTYFDLNDGSKYISVTQLIHLYQKPFDSNFWASYKACEAILGDDFRFLKKDLLSTKKWKDSYLEEYDIDVDEFNLKKEEILQSYKDKSKEACEHGSKVHEMMENLLYQKDENRLKTFGLGGKIDVAKGYYKFDKERAVYPEIMLSYKADEYLKTVGQADLVIKEGNEISVYDWKGFPLDTPIATTKGWKTIGELTLLDEIFDKDGNPTQIEHISNIHYNPCYKIVFDNGDEIVADHEHRWLISFWKKKGVYSDVVMTTEEIKKFMDSHNRESSKIPKIRNAKPINMPDADLPIDPYVLGGWLGDGASACGLITNINPEFWNEIKNRGYKIGDDVSYPGRAESRTVFGLSPELRKLGLIGNKHIPDLYMRASYNQRLDLLRGLMDTDGYYNRKRNRFVMSSTQKWQALQTAELVASLGGKPTIFDVVKKCNGKSFNGWDVCWSGSDFSPFLIRNKDIKHTDRPEHKFRNIESIELVDSVPTKCLGVKSDTKTYLVGRHLIPTHNTNKSIDKESYFDQNTKKRETMNYPLNNLMSSNYWFYSIQLSLYMWMIQKINPSFKCKKLAIIHIDRNGNETEYNCPYLKEEVERMLLHYRKENKKKMLLDRDKPIEW